LIRKNEYFSNYQRKTKTTLRVWTIQDSLISFNCNFSEADLRVRQTPV